MNTYKTLSQASIIIFPYLVVFKCCTQGFILRIALDERNRRKKRRKKKQKKQQIKFLDSSQNITEQRNFISAWLLALTASLYTDAADQHTMNYQWRWCFLPFNGFFGGVPDRCGGYVSLQSHSFIIETENNNNKNVFIYIHTRRGKLQVRGFDAAMSCPLGVGGKKNISMFSCCRCKRCKTLVRRSLCLHPSPPATP